MAKILKNAARSNELCYLNAVVPADIPAAETPVQPEDPQIELMRQAAYDQGYQAAKQESIEAAEQEERQLQQQLQELLVSIPQAIAANRILLNQEIADVVLSIVQHFFIEHQADTSSLEAQINQILSQLNAQDTVELSLHPLELKALHEAKLHLNATHLTSLKIKSDDSLRLGGCVIKTAHGMFDASLEKQIDRLKEYLLQLRERGSHES